MFGKTRIGAIVFYVSDIKRTAAFYRDTLGLEAEVMPGDPDDESGGADWMMAQTAGGVSLVFFEAPGQPGASPIIVFDLADGGIDAVVEGLSKKGVTIVTPVSHAPGGGWTADFADPDGHTLSVFQAAEKPR